MSEKKIYLTDNPAREILKLKREVKDLKNEILVLKDNANILNSISIQIFRVNKKNKILWANKIAIRKSGLKKEDVIGNRCNDIWQRNCFVCQDCPAIQVFKSKKKCSGEINSPDGKWWYLDCFPYIKKKGIVSEVIVFKKEITREKESKQATNKRNELYRKLIDMSPHGFLLTDSNSKIIIANKQFVKILELKSVDQIIGKNALGLARRQKKKLALIVFKSLLKLKSNWRGELSYTKRDGNKTILEASVSVIYDEEGKPSEFVSIIRDVTISKQIVDALREREIDYRILFETSIVGIILFDVKGKILIANPQALEFFKYKNSKDMVGKNIINFVKSDERENLKKHIRKLRKSGELRSITMNFIRADRSVFPCEFNVSIIYDLNGKPKSYLGIGMDISERKKFLNNVIKKQKLNSIGILAGGIAHDFNNALTTISGNISLLLKSLKDTGLKEMITDALSAVARIRGLTKQLLLFTDVEDPDMRLVDTAEFIVEAVDFALVGSKIYCEYNLPGDIWKVRISQGRMSQVINNILLNSKEAMKRRSGKVIVKVENVTLKKDIEGLTPGNYVKISIKDNGPGISQKNLPKIFDPYFTTKRTTSGLGLAIAYNIILKHNGYINVISDKKTGTEVYFYLPVRNK